MTDEAPPPPTISLPAGFHFDEVTPAHHAALTVAAERSMILPRFISPAPPLGVLVNFTGTFAGTGFNTIFRPNSGAPTTTTFVVPVQPPPPIPPSENVLELNLTKESLAFADPLGKVPNRGLEAQNDIFLNGVPYVQTVQDVTNPVSGKGDALPTDIHFEPGLWMNIPATKNTPVLENSLTRMASIPHGTTINAQCLAPTVPTNGPPNIPPVSITPFIIGSPQQLIRFPSQTAANGATPRIPQDLTKFMAAGTITQQILDDPNKVLRDAIAGQTITKTITFTVSTSPTPPSPEFGGGTDNIAFLEGNPAVTAPNANAAKLTATFWIETVEHKIQIPIFKAGQLPLKISPAERPGQISPVFHVEPPHDIPHPITITVSSTQIQYSQVVNLNFAGLTWPHVSVATLVPTTPHTVPPSAWL